MSKRSIEPTVLVIFGATGGLSRERLFPALYHLFSRHLTAKDFTVLGFARSEFSHEDFRNYIKPKNAKAPWDKFAKRIYYHPGNFRSPEDFKRIATFLHNQQRRKHECANHLFYFATLPSHYETISRELKKSGLLMACGEHQRKVRILVEKPFGSDMKSAQKLDHTLSAYFEEEQIYRIDHYLAKETVQNIFTIRFANSIFEPIWNKNYIDHIEISALEDVGVGNRGAFYEESGALRDFVQNHLLQLLALTTIEQPANLDTESLRHERVKVIKAIRKPQARELKRLIIRGQYLGYRKEKKVSPNSAVETFVAIKLFIDNERWRGVPFYLRTGKNLRKKITEISVHFKKPVGLFPENDLAANVLTFQIQPNEGVYLNFLAKYPGTGIRLHPVRMQLSYQAAFAEEIPAAYERLLLDFMQGDQRLFARSDEIENSWKFIDSITKSLGKLPVKSYEPGSSGPKEADTLITKDSREWWTK